MNLFEEGEVAGLSTKAADEVLEGLVGVDEDLLEEATRVRMEREREKIENTGGGCHQST